jgi:ABC-type uncharacterized transport system substrate-binding protein
MKATKAMQPLILAMAVATTGAMAGTYDGKKVLFIDSYHEGYPWSDGITEGVQATINGSGAELKVMRLDTKRNKGEAFKQAAAEKAKAEIESFQPDVVIAADDNASKYLIQPFYKDASLPFVFCGVNWDESVYGYPYKNVTGMVEVAGAKELVELLQQFAKGSRVGLLADDTLSSRKDADNYKSKLGLDLTPAYVASMDDWKKKFTELQGQVDILIVGNVAGINDFDPKAAEVHALANAKIPSGAVQSEPMPYAMIGYLKVPEEQGAWAAESALKILGGTSPADIPIVRNKEGQVMVNVKIAQAAGIEIPYSLIETASSVIE